MNKPTVGDYVLATKYEDGDPGDQWAVGFFHSMLPKIGGDRYMIIDNDEKQFRGNGFRRCEIISHEVGCWFASHTELIDSKMRTFYYDEEGIKHGESIWDIAIAVKWITDTHPAS